MRARRRRDVDADADRDPLDDLAGARDVVSLARARRVVPASRLRARDDVRGGEADTEKPALAKSCGTTTLSIR